MPEKGWWITSKKKKNKREERKWWTRTGVENQVIMLRHKRLDVQLAESKERVFVKDTLKKYGKLATTQHIYTPLQDCIYKKWEKQGMQDDKSDRPQPTMAP